MWSTTAGKCCRRHDSGNHASPTPLSPKEAEAGMAYDGHLSGTKADLIRANKGGALHSRIIQLEATAGYIAGQP